MTTKQDALDAKQDAADAKQEKAEAKQEQADQQKADAKQEKIDAEQEKQDAVKARQEKRAAIEADKRTPKVGDVVLYSAYGKQYKALVRHVNRNEASMLGKHGEPPLHLAFLAPDRDNAAAKAHFGYLPEVLTDYDVVHFSHVFPDEHKQAKGLFTPAQIATARGAGEWRELMLLEDPQPDTPAPSL